jgi:hypothetical protein
MPRKSILKGFNHFRRSTPVLYASPGLFAKGAGQGLRFGYLRLQYA